ncbi:cobaltochelatase subunit CobN [Campylobacter sp.]|uniref:cobaltochelatase subunit CobN n=1 Tax=Campylobacter sp. TaxID=205 RepID=UPI002710570A|nr:cobaltochelatase subunit CobN [Campylobacter sp.]
MKIAAIVWSNQAKFLQEISKKTDVEISVLSVAQFSKDLNAALNRCKAILKESNVALVSCYGAKYDENVEKIASELGVEIIFLSCDPIIFSKGKFGAKASLLCQAYLTFAGEENGINLINYLKSIILKDGTKFDEPIQNKQEFGWHPRLGIFDDEISFWKALKTKKFERYIGVLTRQSNITSGNTKVEEAVINAFESKGIGVAMVSYKTEVDKSIGNLSGIDVVKKFFTDKNGSKIEALMKLTSFLLSSDQAKSSEFISSLNIPIINPVISYYKNEQEWFNAPEGLGSQVAFSISMPELEGVIEPIIIGASDESLQSEDIGYSPIDDRIEKISNRIIRWLNLRRKPNSEKKVAFILNNNPCVGAESSVGGGAHLDTLESVARILARMKKDGYDVRVPKDGKEIIDEILSKKALSEFRFTSADDIVNSGGAIDLLEAEIYRSWFEEFPKKTKDRMISSWGNPPGEKINNIPAAMLYQGKIIISGLDFKNAVVLVQPKRGCAGSRCDGEVCLILHDPDVPPPHQYIATYRWLDRVFKADVIVHVGTHGNVEFLPGKASGMSRGCYSDIALGDMPHLYIYNCDNPVEGIIAKRRSYAVTVNHMQTAMQDAGLYGDLLELQKLINEYERFKILEPAKAHTIEHIIMSHKALASVLGKDEKITHENFTLKLAKISSKLDELSGSYIPRGMHIFGDIPRGDRRSAILNSIIRWGLDEKSLRGIIAKDSGINTKTCSERELNIISDRANAAVCAFSEQGVSLQESLNLDDKFAPDLLLIEKKLKMISHDLDKSDEMGSLLNGFDGGFIRPGQSGLLTRGNYEILPTGRNLYGIDPYSCPSKSAWEIGKMLANAVIEKFKEESDGRYPKNIAFYWQCTDLMWTGGEMYAQLLYLLGCEPIWDEATRVKKFRIMSLSELNRPRIDITVRVSGVTRDNFLNTIELLDEAIVSVANLDEPEHLNYVRASTLLKQKEGLGKQSSSARIFGSAPGTYQSGTNLAIYASAWNNEKDLTDIYLFWNSYSYGKNRFGIREVEGFKSALKSVDVTFNKTATDEYDLTGCCCYFGGHGGLINAARDLKGEEIKNYYGDTREQGRVAVRTLAEEMRRVSRSKILNPKWIEGMQEHGYKGASEISKRVGRVYGWQATSKEVDNEIFDDIARTFLLDEKNREFFEKNNPYALEEIARRLIEAEARGLYNPADDVKDELKEQYIQIEGWIEDSIGSGDIQGGSIDVFSASDVSGWKEKLKEVLK